MGKLLVAMLAAGVLFLVYDYATAPVFWKRMMATFSSSGSGAYSAVFDVTETVRGRADSVFYFSGYGAQRVYVSQDEELVIVRTGPAAGYFPKIIEEWDNSYLFNRTVTGIREAQRSN